MSLIIDTTGIIEKKVRKQIFRLRSRVIGKLADELELYKKNKQFALFEECLLEELALNDSEQDLPDDALTEQEIEDLDDTLTLPILGTRLEDITDTDLCDDEADTDSDDNSENENDESKIPVIQIDEKKSPPLERHLRRRYEVEVIPEEITKTLTYEEITSCQSWNFVFLNRNCMMNYKPDSKSVILVEPFSGEQELTIFFERPNIYLRFPDDPEEVPCKIVAILDKTYLKLFEKFDFIYKKIGSILEFSKLTEAQKKAVMDTANKKIESENVQNDHFMPISGKTSLRVCFDICKNGIPEPKRKIIEQLFEELEFTREQKPKEDLIVQLSYAINIDTNRKPHKELNYEQIMAIFHKHIYGMDDLAESIAEHILAYQYSGGGSFAILLVGHPGVGKTAVCEAIAEALDCKLTFIDCSGTNYLALNGTTKSYTAAQPGKIAKGLFEYGTADLVCQLDELDKLVTANKDGDAFSALIKPLGPQKLLHDEFLDYDIDVSATKFIATANNIKSIPNYILDRFGNNIFYMPDYSPKDKAEIGKHYLAPKLLKENGIKEDELVFTDEALQLVAKEYCDDYGARKMESYIRTLIRKAIKLWSMDECTKPLMIDKDFVLSQLKKPKTTSNKAGFI